MSTLRTRVRLLFATLAQMTSANPVLLEGEQWTEKDADTGQSTGRRKVGDGVTAFNSLGFEPGGTGGATTEEIQDAAAALFTGGTHSGISFTYNDAANRIDATVTGGGGGGATDLSIANRGATTLDVASSTGTDVTLPAATNTQAGLATAAQITKLEGVPSDALSAATAASTYQPLDGDLTSIAGLAGTSGLLRKTAANTFTLDTSTFLTANQSITVSGDATGSGTTSIALTLASVGTAGTYRSVTTDAKGRVTAGTNPTTLSGYGITDAAAIGAVGSSGLTMGTGVLLGRSTAGTGAIESISLGSGLSLSAGTLSVSAGGGNVSNSGTPSAGQVAQWASSSTIEGVNTTGSGNYVRATSPTLVTPALGTPASGTLTNCTGLPTSGITAFAADTRAQVEAALVAGTNVTITPSGTGATRQLTIASTGGGGGGDALVANPLSQFAATTSAQLRGVISDETGTGALVFATSPTLVTPVLGTPSSGTLTNCTGLPIGGITMSTARLLGRATAGSGAAEEFALGGALSFNSGTLALTDPIKLRISNTGELATAANNHTEVTVDRACTVVGAKWECAPTATGSSASNAMLYARRSGTKTSLLSANASLGSGVSVTDATGSLTGTLTLAANDTLGVDLVSVGTGCSGIIFTILVRYS